MELIMHPQPSHSRFLRCTPGAGLLLALRAPVALLALLSAAGAHASPAAADDFQGYFHLSNWTLVNEPAAVGGSVDINAGPPIQIFINGGNLELAGDTDFRIHIPVAGHVSFNWGYNSTDSGCRDSGGYVIDDDYTVLACNDAPVGNFGGSINLFAEGGRQFAFRVATEDGLHGNGTLGVTNFRFVPRRVFSDSFRLPASTDFRIEALKLRDPHTFIDAGFLGCIDMTDNAPFDLPTTNSLIAQQLDGDANGDGFYDLSPLLRFQPLDLSGASFAFRSAYGACARPPAAPGCMENGRIEPIAASYASQTSGLCLGPIPGTTRPYTPPVPVIDGTCFSSSAENGSIAAGSLLLPLQAIQVAGNWVGTHAVVPGLLRGFLRESDADQTLLPSSYPVVGGQPLSSLFPGGSGNCSAADDRDIFEGESGWWMYLEFTAAKVRMHE
jgi:hypothetical protein